MDAKQIEDVFYKVIEKRGISEKLEGISKDVIYHWRKKSRSVTIGDMLNVLYQVGIIDIKLLKNEVEFDDTIVPEKKNPGFWDSIDKEIHKNLIQDYWEPIKYLYDGIIPHNLNRVASAEDSIKKLFEEIKYLCKLNKVNVWIEEGEFRVEFHYYLNIRTQYGLFQKQSRLDYGYQSVDEILEAVKKTIMILKNEPTR